MNNQLAFDTAEREFGIQPVIRGEEMAAAPEPDQLLMVLYLSKFYEAFRTSPGNTSGQVPSRTSFNSVAPSCRRQLRNISLTILDFLMSAVRSGCRAFLQTPNKSVTRSSAISCQDPLWRVWFGPSVGGCLCPRVVVQPR